MRKALARQGRVREVSIPAPTRGLVLSQNPSRTAKDAAEVLENWIPTDRGIRVRGGLEAGATTEGTAVTSLFSYVDPSLPALFAATATAIYDMSGLNATTAPTPVIANQTAGYYSTQQIGTGGGSYLYAVNGSDYAWLFDGTDWNPVAGVAVNEISYDALVTDFEVGETVSGGSSGASAEILAVIPATATTGTLKIGTVTSGPFTDNETLTSASGEADADGANSAASSIAITSADTSTFSAVWLYRNRLFFVVKNTLKAEYLPVDSVGGAAAEVSLAGVFQKGGSLLFGATWSLDSGSGLDDKCVFVSTEGEVAVYRGSDPSDADDWYLEGRYDVAEPLGVNAAMQAGGDLVIATVDGIFSLSEVIRKDPAALSVSAVSRPIEDLWTFEARRATSPIELVKWPERSLAIVTLPDASRTLLIHLQTGAWCVATGWSANCATTYLGKCYIGLESGEIVAIDETGLDLETPYVAKYGHAFDDFGKPTYKAAQQARYTFYAPFVSTFELKASIGTNFNHNFPSPPNAVSATAYGDYLIWDSGNWDEGLWWSEAVLEETNAVTVLWRTVTGSGNTLAPQLQITSGSDEKPSIELLRTDLTFREGRMVA